MSINRASLSDQIYEQLKEEILTGNMAPGTRLTSKDLQNRFSVSSTPVRDATNRLAQEGFLAYTTNQGVRVVELTLEDVSQLLEVRCLYDCHAIKKAMEVPEREQLIAELKAAIESQKRYNENSKYEPEVYREICYSFHEILCAYSKNTWLMEAAARVNGLLFLADARQKNTSYPQEAIDEHQAVLDAIIAGDRKLAVKKMRLHKEREEARFRKNK